jgi:selenocysteine lyase/cysteine desulfurase
MKVRHLKSRYVAQLNLQDVANVGPWKKLAARSGAIVKYWKATPTKESNPYSVALQLEDVLPLITPRTRIVAFTACSNILGTIVPVKDYTAAIRKKAAELGVPKLEISIDCVAYAPHRRIDVQDWDVDFCVLSFYKVRYLDADCLLSSSFRLCFC